ncbi:hypothetical protein A10D4_05257 [Idiomarina xiamenensis 10-D-4]|uniref:Prokaryotic-type class I peptide chain release factors domain-containing protein n=2 Tax=Idiomarina xiamenensis TaxID=1207041 RepID=K2KPR1_9GAMM|nr:hypothetical protein A10D4_05257 [Idiomarina xiamenensis 10-D-4]
MDMQISQRVSLREQDLQWQFIRSSGAGGQNVNKVATAVQLIFDIRASSLPDFYQQRLLNKNDHRITVGGKIIIKCQQTRSQANNRELALAQLVSLIRSVAYTPKKRIETKPTKAVKARRQQKKQQQSQKKALRRQRLTD